MNVDQKLQAILAAIQQDPGNRGLGRDPAANLFNACPDDFANACRSLAEHPAPVLGVVTGFWIPAAKLGETDGPLGAVYLARTLPEMGVGVVLASDPFCGPALVAGLTKCGGTRIVPVLELARHAGPSADLGLDKTLPFSRDAESSEQSATAYTERRRHDNMEASALRSEDSASRLNNSTHVNHDCVECTHVLALERVGPSHTPASIRAQAGADEQRIQRFLAEVPQSEHGRCHTMRGMDITEQMCEAASLFEHVAGADRPVTIGIGDGGNEIGMGKVSWDVIHRNIPRGAVIACRIATDYLIVAGVSNWGAYALAAGVALVRGFEPPEDWFDIEKEREILAEMVEKGPLVDGVKGRPEVSVDGLEFEAYTEPLRQIAAIVRA